MSYLSKSSSIEENNIIWPGFVDILASTLMVIIFVVLLFTVSQVYLGDLVVGKNQKIQNLEKTIDIQDDTIVVQDETLASKEKVIGKKEEIIGKKEEIIGTKEQIIETQDSDIINLSNLVNKQTIDIKDLNEIISQITNELSISLEENRNIQNDIISLQQEQQTLSNSLLSSNTERDSLNQSLTLLESEKTNFIDKINELNSKATKRNQDLEIALSKISNLSNNVEILTKEILTLNNILDTKEIEINQSKIEIGDLGERLNRVLTSELFKLQKYRSEFFGKLNELLSNRSEIKVKGDRFVFQSEILFKSGSANIEISGKEALSSVSILILDLIEEIPSNLNWVLQVDGHTDKIPIYTQEFPSNWELSHARALEVVKFFISQGIPSKRLSANGYGDNQPIVFGDSPDELKLNRRIELKITQR